MGFWVLPYLSCRPDGRSKQASVDRAGFGQCFMFFVLAKRLLGSECKKRNVAGGGAAATGWA